MSVIIRLQNLPWSGNARDIREFFKGESIPEGGVHIVGGEQGDAFIAFSTDEDARLAMRKTGNLLKGIQVTLLLSSRAEMQQVIEQARQTALAMHNFMAPPQGMGSQGGPPQGMGSQGGPPQGMGSQGGPPQGMGSQGGPPQGMGSQGGPPQGMGSQGGGGNYGSPSPSMGQGPPPQQQQQQQNIPQQQQQQQQQQHQPHLPQQQHQQHVQQQQHPHQHQHQPQLGMSNNYSPQPPVRNSSQTPPQIPPQMPPQMPPQIPPQRPPQMPPQMPPQIPPQIPPHMQSRMPPISGYDSGTPQMPPLSGASHVDINDQPTSIQVPPGQPEPLGPPGPPIPPAQRGGSVPLNSSSSITSIKKDDKKASSSASSSYKRDSSKSHDNSSGSSRRRRSKSRTRSRSRSRDRERRRRHRSRSRSRSRDRSSRSRRRSRSRDRNSNRDRDRERDSGRDNGRESGRDRDRDKDSKHRNSIGRDRSERNSMDGGPNASISNNSMPGVNDLNNDMFPSSVGDSTLPGLGDIPNPSLRGPLPPLPDYTHDGPIKTPDNPPVKPVSAQGYEEGGYNEMNYMNSGGIPPRDDYARAHHGGMGRNKMPYGDDPRHLDNQYMGMDNKPMDPDNATRMDMELEEGSMGTDNNYMGMDNQMGFDGRPPHGFNKRPMDHGMGQDKPFIEEEPLQHFPNQIKGLLGDVPTEKPRLSEDFESFNMSHAESHLETEEKKEMYGGSERKRTRWGDKEEGFGMQESNSEGQWNQKSEYEQGNESQDSNWNREDWNGPNGSRNQDLGEPRDGYGVYEEAGYGPAGHEEPGYGSSGQYQEEENFEESYDSYGGRGGYKDRGGRGWERGRGRGRGGYDSTREYPEEYHEEIYEEGNSFHGGRGGFGGRGGERGGERGGRGGFGDRNARGGFGETAGRGIGFGDRGRGGFGETAGRGIGFGDRGRGGFGETSGRGTEFGDRGRGGFGETSGRGIGFGDRSRGGFGEISGRGNGLGDRGRGGFGETAGRGIGFGDRGRGTFGDRGRGAFGDRGRGAFGERSVRGSFGETAGRGSGFGDRGGRGFGERGGFGDPGGFGEPGGFEEHGGFEEDGKFEEHGGFEEHGRFDERGGFEEHGSFGERGSGRDGFAERGGRGSVSRPPRGGPLNEPSSFGATESEEYDRSFDMRRERDNSFGRERTESPGFGMEEMNEFGARGERGRGLLAKRGIRGGLLERETGRFSPLSDRGGRGGDRGRGGFGERGGRGGFSERGRYGMRDPNEEVGGFEESMHREDRSMRGGHNERDVGGSRGAPRGGHLGLGRDGSDDRSKPKITCAVEISPLPKNRSNYKIVRDLFTGIYIPHDSIKFLSDEQGNRTGVALMKFSTPRDAMNASKRTGGYVLDQRVDIRLIDDEIYEGQVDTANKPFKDGQGDTINKPPVHVNTNSPALESKPLDDNQVETINKPASQVDTINKSPAQVVTTNKTTADASNKTPKSVNNPNNNSQVNANAPASQDSTLNKTSGSTSNDAPALEKQAPPTESEPSPCLYVSGLPLGCGEHDVAEVFNNYIILDVVLDLVRGRRVPNGGCFIRLSSPEEAQKAYKDLLGNATMDMKSLAIKTCPLHGMEQAVEERDAALKNTRKPPIRPQDSKPGDINPASNKNTVQNKPEKQSTSTKDILLSHLKKKPEDIKKDIVKPNSNDIKPKDSAKIVTNEKQKSKKPEPVKPEKNASIAGDLLTDSVVIKGLPRQSSEANIRDFFSDEGLVPEKIHICQISNGFKDAYIMFPRIQDTKLAVAKSNQQICKKKVTVELIPKPTVMKAMKLPFNPLELMKKGQEMASEEAGVSKEKQNEKLLNAIEKPKPKIVPVKDQVKSIPPKTDPLPATSKKDELEAKTVRPNTPIGELEARAYNTGPDSLRPLRPSGPRMDVRPLAEMGRGGPRPLRPRADLSGPRGPRADLSGPRGPRADLSSPRGPRADLSSPRGPRGPRAELSGPRGPQGFDRPNHREVPFNRYDSPHQRDQSPFPQDDQEPDRDEALGTPMPPENFGRPGCVVGVTNVPYRATTEDLIEFFRRVRLLRPDNVIRRYNDNNQPTSDARVSFDNPQEALRAVRMLQGQHMLNRDLRLTIVRDC